MREFLLLWDAKREEREREERLAWETTRWLGWMQCVNNPYMKSKPRTAAELLPLPWDEKKPEVTAEQARMTDGEKNAVKELFTKYFKERDGENR